MVAPQFWRLLLLLAVLAVGCETDAPPGVPPRPLQVSRDAGSINLDSGVGQGLDASRSGSAAVAKLITELRDTKLQLSPRATPPQRLAFGRGTLGVLTDSELVVYDTGDWGEPERVPIEEPRQLLAAADGSLLAVGGKSLYRMAPGKRTPTRHPRVPLFAGSMLFADRLKPTVICVVHRFGATLYQYDLEAEDPAHLLAMTRSTELVEYDGEAFVALNDGSFLYTAGKALRRFFAGGRNTSYPAPTRDRSVWRVLLSRRIDQVWLAHRDGSLDLVQIGSRIAKVRSLALRESPFEITSDSRFIAAIEVEQPPGSPRRWSLEVLDPKGQPVFEEHLPAGHATVGEDWVARVTQNKEVVLAWDAPLVAVGGPSWLRVWNVETGRLVAAPDLTPDAAETGADSDGGP